MTLSPPGGGVIEPFDPARHDRSAFSCGVEQVDNFFRKTANKLVKAGNLRVFVLTLPRGRRSVFMRSTHTRSIMPICQQDMREIGRAMVRFPAVYISMIGVESRSSGGKGYGGDLLADCLKRIARIADNLGVAAVMLDVLDCGNADLTQRRQRICEAYGFMPLPSNSMRLFLPVATIEQLL